MQKEKKMKEKGGERTDEERQKISRKLKKEEQVNKESR